MEAIKTLAQHPTLLLITIALLGLAVGSFLNVVVYRLPLMMRREWQQECREIMELPGDEPEAEPFNLASPGSRCPHCGHGIRAWENIPVISWLLLRGRCSSCGAPISLRYPLVELTTALFSVAVVLQLGPGWESAVALPLTWALIALSLIDLDHQLLPDSIVLPTLWAGMLLSLSGLFSDPVSSIVGASIGYLSLWGVYHLFRLITGKEGMGYGDFKLLALFGAWLGWQCLPQVILLSSLVGAVVGISLMVFARYGRDTAIPFGPYLAAAGWISMIWGEQINALYLGWSGISS